MGLKYDLHIHTALSPCADDDMTPSTVAGMAKLAGLDVIAVADHNSARNLAATKKACDHYGIRLIPAIEANTAEEIHVLCYFPSVHAALEMGELLYRSLPDIPADPDIWGEQLVMDEEDRVTDRISKLLSNAVDMGIYEVKQICEELGGITVPAHADRSAFSIFSVLGIFPEDMDFTTVELRHPGLYERYIQDSLMPDGLEIVFSSDAHRLSDLMERSRYPELESDSALFQLLLD